MVEILMPKNLAGFDPTGERLHQLRISLVE